MLIGFDPLLRRILLATAGPVLLAAHTVAVLGTFDLSGVLAWRRLWSDLALATASWIDFSHGPAAPDGEVARGPAADLRTREVLLRRIEREGLRPTRPLGVLLDRPFVLERIAPEAKPYDDPGRAVLLGIAFRVRGGIAPFLILWLGWLMAAPLLAWAALELQAAGFRCAAWTLTLLTGLSPYVVETLALGRYAVGFHLAACLAIIPVAVYAGLHPSPTGRGLAVRVGVAALILGVCVFCRSSAALLLPGFVVASWLGIRRLSPRRFRQWVGAGAAALLFALPVAAVKRGHHHDVWQPLWEGLGDFDRVKGYVWNDVDAEIVAVRGGAPALWTPQSEDVFRQQVLRDIRSDPAWFTGILARRIGATLTLWKLWPWKPMDGTFLRRRTSPNEGVIDKYWTYTTTVDHFGFGRYRVEVPVILILAPVVALGILAARRHAVARAALATLAGPLVGALAVPVLITAAGGQEAQAIGLVYLLAAALVVDIAWRQGLRWPREMKRAEATLPTRASSRQK